MNENIFKNYGIEVDIKDPENFLKIKETLTRIGISSKKNNTLYQSCHLLHKQGRYAIVHFKEMFALDGKLSSLTDEDKARRNRITILLEDWGLLNIIEKEKVKEFDIELSLIKILSFKDKINWNLESKYNIGKK